jgi:hypothetical protein
LNLDYEIVDQNKLKASTSRGGRGKIAAFVWPFIFAHKDLLLLCFTLILFLLAYVQLYARAVATVQ